MNARNKIIIAVLLCLSVAAPIIVKAKADQGVVITLGKITSIISQGTETVAGTSIKQTVQKITVQILEGPFKDRVIEVDNNVTPLNINDRVYLAISTDEHGNPVANGIGFADAYRLPALGWLALLFIALVFIFGGWQGIRGLASLVGSLAFIFFALLPGLLHGLSPILLSIGVSSLIIIVGSYITHGFNRTTTSAIIGMVI